MNDVPLEVLIRRRRKLLALSQSSVVIRKRSHGSPRILFACKPWLFRPFAPLRVIQRMHSSQCFGQISIRHVLLPSSRSASNASATSTNRSRLVFARCLNNKSTPWPTTLSTIQKYAAKINTRHDYHRGRRLHFRIEKGLSPCFISARTSFKNSPRRAGLADFFENPCNPVLGWSTTAIAFAIAMPQSNLRF